MNNTFFFVLSPPHPSPPPPTLPTRPQKASEPSISFKISKFGHCFYVHGKAYFGLDLQFAKSLGKEKYSSNVLGSLQSYHLRTKKKSFRALDQYRHLYFTWKGQEWDIFQYDEDNGFCSAQNMKKKLFFDPPSMASFSLLSTFFFASVLLFTCYI